jgi:hypothetical protein
MADSTLAKLIHLIAAPEIPALRRAATLVSGSVGSSKDRNLVKALLANLPSDDIDLRLAAIDALGRLRAEEALGPLEIFVRQGGPELESAVQAASNLGARGVKAMSKIMAEVTPSLRSRVAAVLARSGTGGGLVATAHALVDPDPKVVDAAARSLAAEVPSFSTAQKHALARFLSDSLGPKQELAAKTEAAMLRLLGTLRDAKAENIFWARLGPERTPEVRAAALQALGHDAAPTSAVRLQSLVACAAEADFQIVAPALMILKKLPAGTKNAKLWLKLLDAPDVATRRFAVEKLAGVETAEVARGLVDQLAHPDRALRDEARQALLCHAKGRQALLDKLLAVESAEEGWDLARALAPPMKEFADGLRARVLEQAARYHDRDDRRAAPLLYFLREIALGWTRDELEAKALALRQKKKYAEAAGYYHLLAHDPACAENIRFELAAAGLKLSGHDPAVEARQADHALGQFGRLLQNPSFDLLGHVTKAKWLDVGDLYYLGFHFVEQTHRARDFGKEILELVVKRLPRSEIGKNARKKLNSAGAG